MFYGNSKCENSTSTAFEVFYWVSKQLDAKKSNSNFQKIIIKAANHPIVNCTIYLWLEIILSKLVQKNYSEISDKWVGLGLNKLVAVVHKLRLQDEVGRWSKNVLFLSTFIP